MGPNLFTKREIDFNIYFLFAILKGYLILFNFNICSNAKITVILLKSGLGVCNRVIKKGSNRKNV